MLKPVVHSHPAVATGFACSGRALDKPLCAEAIMTLRSVPLAPYATYADSPRASASAGRCSTAHLTGGSPSGPGGAAETGLRNDIQSLLAFGSSPVVITLIKLLDNPNRIT